MKHAKKTKPTTNKKTGRGRANVNRKIFLILSGLFLPLVAGAIWYAVKQQGGDVALFDWKDFSNGFWIGFIAQVFSSALGMGYGVISSSILLAAGWSPLMATSSVHISEAFATGAAALSHGYYGNVNRKMFNRMLIGGIVGALIGVFVVVNFDAKVIKPYMSSYLLLMGVYIFFRAFREYKIKIVKSLNEIVPFSFVAGFFDSVGGGGWGSILTPTLLGQGRDPRITIGSVNGARFFITTASGTAFLVMVGLQSYELVIGIIISGVFIAPFAARLVKSVPSRILCIMAGSTIALLSAWNLHKALLDLIF
ncbi:MAG: sulfite exporter TauE/SafE family protein [Alphaproteobacteria bacterium]